MMVVMTLMVVIVGKGRKIDHIGKTASLPASYKEALMGRSHSRDMNQMNGPGGFYPPSSTMFLLAR